MSNNKSKKRVYSKPTKVVEPVEEKIEEITEEVIEAKAIDPEVFETKLFVEEEPEEIKVEQHIEGEKLAEVLEQNHNVDAVAELEKVLQSEGADQLGIDAEVEMTKLIEAANETPSLEGLPTPNELTEKLVELQAKIEDFQVVQVVPESTGLVYGEDYHEDLKALAPEPPAQKTIASLSNAELRHFRRTGQMPR